MKRTRIDTPELGAGVTVVVTSPSEAPGCPVVDTADGQVVILSIDTPSGTLDLENGIWTIGAPDDSVSGSED